jgi:hypothetical protein
MLAHIPEQDVQLADQESIDQRFGQIFDQMYLYENRLADGLNHAWDEQSDEIDESLEDMFAVFDSDRLWDDFDNDFYEDLPRSEEERFQDLVVRGDLTLTIFALARHDRIFRERLQNAVTFEICADDFLQKLDNKRKEFLTKLDSYAASGPKLIIHSVSTIALRLREITQKISEYKARNHAPLSSSFDIKASEFVLGILKDVCTRNKDIYTGSQWLEEPPPADIRDRNLFVNLVSNPSHRGYFVLDFLADEIPPSAWVPVVGHMKSILDQLHQMEVSGPYVRKMEELVAQFDAGPQIFSEPEELISETAEESDTDQWPHSRAEQARPDPPRSSAGARRPSILYQPEAVRRRLD